MRPILLVLVLLYATSHAAAQDSTDYYLPRTLTYTDRTYVPYIRTVILQQKEQPMSLPVIKLGSDDQLELKFDALGEDIRTYGYRIQHCTPTWAPSVLSENDYTEGFFTDQLTDYRHSLNTLQPYWHYRLEFPNSQMRPIISGNYLLVVFDNSQPDSIILSRRFYVVEQRVGFNTNIHRSTIIEQRNSHQEADFSVQLNGLPVSNPYSDIYTVIQQNRDPNFTLQGLRPVFANGESLDYNHDDINNFEGGCEYRNFDLRSTRFLTQFIAEIGTDTLSKISTALLKPEKRRTALRYTADNDLNGNYLIKIYEGRDADLEGDYVLVTFRLSAPQDFTNDPVYIEGAFTEYAIRRQYRMDFNPATGFFECTLLVKQGYYNYRYLTATAGGTVTQLETEGSHYETLNDYQFFTYWKEPGTRYERLVGCYQVQAGGF